MVGVRLADGKTFIYAPPDSHTISPHEVLIVVTPMIHSDELRLKAHGSETKRPTTLRRVDPTKSGHSWSVDEIKAMMDETT